MGANDFWEMSPKELTLELDAARLRREDERDRDLIHAWMVAWIRVRTDNAKKLPSLKTLIEEMHQVGDKQTVGQLKSQLLVLSEQLGIPLRKAKPRGR